MLQLIRQEDPDVVCFQELNPEIAAALQHTLLADYPFQALEARPGVTGMGVISKVPLQPAAAAFERAGSACRRRWTWTGRGRQSGW